MRVVQLTNPEKIEIRDVPARREAEPQELLLRPLLVGLTGTDVLRFRKGAPLSNGFRHPHIPGSEFVAQVMAVGRGVECHFEGARVVGNPISPCLTCEWCLNGKQHLCPNARMLGRPPVNGALQGLFSWPAAQCVVVPPEIPNELAVLMMPLSMAIHISDLAAVRVMDRVAVVGCGHLGLLLIEVLRAAGAGEIIGVDPLDYRREAAIAHGATQVIHPFEERPGTEHWRRAGVDVAIDVSNASEGPREAISLTRLGGKVLLAGIPADNRILFSAEEARHKELTVQFVRRPHKTLARAVALLRTGRLASTAGIVTHHLPLAEIAEGFRLLKTQQDRVIKVIIDMENPEPRE